MRKGNQWDIVKAQYLQAVESGALPRVQRDYCLQFYQGTVAQRLENIGKIDPQAFVAHIQQIAPHIKPTTVDRHRRKLERQWPSNI